MDVRIKRTDSNAVIPSYATEGDAGLDLTAISKKHIDVDHIKYGFGLALEIPEGFVGLIYPRSSCYKKNQLLSNCVGVIDSSYRGEISAVFIKGSQETFEIGDRIAQLIIMPYPKVNFIAVKEISKTLRGIKGYGSTGSRNGNK